MELRIIKFAIFLVLWARTSYKAGRSFGFRPSFFPLAFRLMSTIFATAVIFKAIDAIFG